MNMADLNSLFGALWQALPHDAQADFGCLALSSANLPAPPEHLETGSLCLTTHLHGYGDYLVDVVSIEADRPALGQLGLLVLSAMFHPAKTRVKLALTHPRSSIRELWIEREATCSYGLPGLQLAPVAFNYSPQTVSRHPWLQEIMPALRPHDLPVLSLTNQREDVTTRRDLDGRDVAIGFGALEACVRFAELLLNASQPANQELEFCLEGEAGFRGVGLMSAEIDIWLPGGLGYQDAYPMAFD